MHVDVIAIACISCDIFLMTMTLFLRGVRRIHLVNRIKEYYAYLHALVIIYVLTELTFRFYVASCGA